MQTREIPQVVETPPKRTRPRRLIAATSAALIAALAVGLVAVVLNGGDGDPVAADPDQVRIDAAIATAETFHAAINAGDVDALIAMSNPDVTNLVKDRSMWELNAVLARDYPFTLGDCESPLVAGELRFVTDEFVEVHCNITISDPVWQAEGVGELVSPLRVFNDGTTAWRPFQGGDFSAANQAYADYLQAFHASEYQSVCSPAAYDPGAIISHRGLALTGECAELYIPLAPDVAEWVRGGKQLP